MRERVLVPEILDDLPDDDPRAIRSRRDLRMINAMLRSYPWIERELRKCPDALEKGVIEIGAGDGGLSSRLDAIASVTAVDLVTRPDGVAAGVDWKSGDVFEILPVLNAGAVVANLFIHHFEGQPLRDLAEAIDETDCDLILFCEPLRTMRGHLTGATLWPMVNDVTWHDMHVSIDAGFRPGELPTLFSAEWQWEESTTFLGGLRSVGRRQR